jgi:hypothetical protein
MKRGPSHRPRNSIHLLAFFTLLTASVIALAAAHVEPAANLRNAVAFSPDAPGTGYMPPPTPRKRTADRQEAVEAEVIALRPSGFGPAEITRPAGRVLVAVSNQTGTADVVLRLSKEGDKRAHEVRLSKNKRLWRKVVDLAPGAYTLTEASHPEWTCRIIITP